MLSGAHKVGKVPKIPACQLTVILQKYTLPLPVDYTRQQVHFWNVTAYQNAEG